ncbi:uncharacterized protein [Euwallacea fornicatus]|uniref:uncharacterized protein n=1 Tax=Euwallacea fornicatus TaxID=995702 RepID=UPI00338F246D
MADEEADARDGAATRFAISKVHVRPGKPFNTKNSVSTTWTNCLTNLPVIPEKPGRYVPMPYTFRRPRGSKPAQVKNVTTRCPPFHLLVDHTIAVIWSIFSPEQHESPLGIVQLHWAWSFLKTVRLRNGDRPKDVELCIDNIEETLMERYAMLNLELGKISGGSPDAEEAFGPERADARKFSFSVNYGKLVAKLGESAMEGEPPIAFREAQLGLDSSKDGAGAKSIGKADLVARKEAIDLLEVWYGRQSNKISEEMRKLKSVRDQIDRLNGGSLDVGEIEPQLLDDD